MKVGPGDYVLWVLLAVGVKATTTEGMGFETRGEGVSATAVCLLERGLERSGGWRRRVRRRRRSGVFGRLGLELLGLLFVGAA